jgi:hypothetical protein
MWKHNRPSAKVYKFADAYVKQLLLWAYENTIVFKTENDIKNWTKTLMPSESEHIRNIKKLANERKLVREHMFKLLNEYSKKDLRRMLFVHKFWSENYVKVIKGQIKKYPEVES